jgi:aminoglycoside phosphotransferase (APT) family kinase protein
MAEGGPAQEMTRSSRDPRALHDALETWLTAQVGRTARVTDLRSTSANGMSSETVLFDATWGADDDLGGDATAGRGEQLVARLAPADTDVPVFPSYDLRAQYETMRLVGEHSSVPVPRVWWYEGDPAVAGTPFFVMSRVDGDVPPDVMPYPFGECWLYDASAAEQRRLQESTIRVLAGLHSISEPARLFGFLDRDERGDTPLARKVARTRDWYEWVVAGAARSRVVDAALAWLEAQLPVDDAPAVLSWGDARIGNVMYRDFEPVAVLDWEMACLGPPELDLAWLAYSHEVFQTLAATYGLPGMPGFLRLDDVATEYEAQTGRTPRHLEYHRVLAAVQWAIVFVRTSQRAVRFGERDAPDDVDDVVMNREPLAQMISGTARR